MEGGLGDRREKRVIFVMSPVRSAVTGFFMLFMDFGDVSLSHVEFFLSL